MPPQLDDLSVRSAMTPGVDLLSQQFPSAVDSEAQSDQAPLTQTDARDVIKA